MPCQKGPVVCPGSPKREPVPVHGKILLLDPELSGTLLPPYTSLSQTQGHLVYCSWKRHPPLLQTFGLWPVPSPLLLLFPSLVRISFCLSSNSSADSTSWVCPWFSQVCHGPPSDSHIACAPRSDSTVLASSVTHWTCRAVMESWSLQRSQRKPPSVLSEMAPASWASRAGPASSVLSSEREG